MTTLQMTDDGAVTIQLDLPALLQHAGLVQGYDEDGVPQLTNGFRDEVYAEILRAVVQEFTRDKEVRKAITEAVAAAAAETVQSSLDQEFQPTNEWGERQGPRVSLRDALRNQATEQVRSWLKKPTGYSRDSDFQEFLRREVQAAVTADLNGELKAAREALRARVQEFAAEKLTTEVLGRRS